MYNMENEHVMDDASKVITLHNEGYHYLDIVKKLGVSEGFVTDVIGDYMDTYHLDRDGALSSC